jgi:CheY-like chemotaxis protein
MSSQKIKILLVDDDIDDLNIIAEALTSHSGNIDITKAENGRDALKHLKEADGNYPNLIILDINMPVLDGKKTLLKLQEDAKLNSIPVVILTTSSNQADHKYFEKMNIKMLTKPWDSTQIREIVQKLVNMAEQN